MTVRSFLGLGAVWRLHFTGHTSIKVCNNVSNTFLAHHLWLVHYISHTWSLVLAKGYAAALSSIQQQTCYKHDTQAARKHPVASQ